MTARERLQNRRRCESFEFSHAGMRFTLCAGMWPDDRIGEVFISSNKPGSPIEAVARDGAILVSLCLQHGVAIETIKHALTRDDRGAPATLLSSALDALAEGNKP